ncbi:MAG TPA: NAD-dependent epimerase/dehydratase family protein [Saprospiraceae bacterium]|nr:NAD-dependent epimerase/dehydratase family protein [Saprospiraceae bacterium]
MKEINENSRILITGATGQVGSYITRYLVKKGYKNISILKRKHSKIELLEPVLDQLNPVVGDVLDGSWCYDVVKDFDVIIHAAAQVTFDPKYKSQMFKNTVEGTTNLVNAALEARDIKIVHISSIAAIGRSKDNETIDESLTWKKSKFNTTYAISKFLAEQEVWRGFAEGLQGFILNPSFVLGAGHWNKSSLQIVNKLASGLSYYPGGSNGFVDVRDIAKAAYLGIKEKINHQRIIISSGNESYKVVFDQICANLDVPAPHKKLTKGIARIVWNIDKVRTLITGKEALLTEESFYSTSIISNYVNEKSKETLGLEYIPIKKAIDDMTNCYRQTKNKGFGILDFY